MIKKIGVILAVIFTLIFSVLFIATTFKEPIIPNQYCEQIYSYAKQCVPGCVWELHEPEFTGFVIEKNSTPFIPQGTPTCNGR